MLHSCDAGEHSVLSIYPSVFELVDPMDGFGEAAFSLASYAMRWFYYSNTMPIHGAYLINYNTDKFDKPYETPVIVGGFMFSYGHLIPNAGYSK